jgi:hypothetical protein
MKVTHPKTDDIKDRSWRRHQDPDLQKLVTDVRKNGILVPIILSAKGTLVDGQRRLDAARATGLQNTPTIQARDWKHLADLVLAAIDADDTLLMGRYDLYHWATTIRQEQIHIGALERLLLPKPANPAPNDPPAWITYIGDHPLRRYPDVGRSFLRATTDIESKIRLRYGKNPDLWAWAQQVIESLEDPAVGLYTIRAKIFQGPPVTRPSDPKVAAAQLKAINAHVPSFIGSVKGLKALLDSLDPGAVDLMELERALGAMNELRTEILRLFNERNYTRAYPKA